jgi:hypothetical protein
MTATNKRLLIFESRSDSNRCTPCRGNLTNTTRTLPTPVHVCPAYASCGRSPYVATFHAVVDRFERVHCTQQEGLPTQSSARRLTDPRVHTQLLFHNSQRSGEKKSSFCRQPTTRLTGPISPACDRYIQYLLAGTTRTVLNRPRTVYNLEGVGLPHTHSPTFLTSCLHFPLMAPPSLHFNQVLATNPKCE